MSEYKVSIIVPGIRPKNWARLHNSISTSCNKHSWEIVFIGPYDPPTNVAKLNNVKYLKDYGTPNKCVQRATTIATGELYALGADDGHYLPNAFSESIDLYDSLNARKDVVIQKYMEGAGMTGSALSADNYYACNFEMASPYLPKHYMFAMNPLMNMDYFRELGGLDCQFEFTNFAGHDLSYRIQRDGGKFHLSTSEVLTCDHMPGTTGDHAPIHYAHPHDVARCQKIYRSKDCETRIKIDFDNWKAMPEYWERRWPKGIV